MPLREDPQKPKESQCFVLSSRFFEKYSTVFKKFLPKRVHDTDLKLCGIIWQGVNAELSQKLIK